MQELRVIIAGGRNFNDYAKLRKASLCVISDVVGTISRENVTIISGKASGADTLGERFAKDYGLNTKEFPANWDLYGKRAGYLRNQEMARYAIGENESAEEKPIGILIAFWDGKSKGTKLMIDIATEKKMRVFVFGY